MVFHCMSLALYLGAGLTFVTEMLYSYVFYTKGLFLTLHVNGICCLCATSDAVVLIAITQTVTVIVLNIIRIQ